MTTYTEHEFYVVNTINNSLGVYKSYMDIKISYLLFKSQQTWAKTMPLLYNHDYNISQDYCEIYL